MKTETKPTTIVIFRKFKKEGDIIALFPDSRLYHCNSYQHIGQHGAADYRGLLKSTVLATPAEYEDLKNELTRIGYSLVIRKRY